MGLYSTKQQIVRAALSRITSIPTPAVASFVSPQEEHYLSVLNEILASEMETNIYPFAVTYMLLQNPVVDEVLNPENDKIIFNIPQYAIDIGIFDEDSLPSIASVVEDNSRVKGSSYNYSFFGSDNLIVEADPDEGKQLYFVHTSINPPISRMFTSFQMFLVYQIAYENYFKVGTNSRFLESLRQAAIGKKSIAKRLCISSSQDFNRNILTLEQILEYGKPGGTV